MKTFFKIVFYLRSRINLKGRGGIYFYAIVSGCIAAVVALAFQFCTKTILAALTGVNDCPEVQSFQQIEPWRRVAALTIGGILAGTVLVFASKKIKQRATPYMESVSIGNGYIPVRANLLRSLAAIITIGSGASIGREGPLVQTATVFASIFGRRINLSTPRLRLLIACAASGAMSAVFHTPLAGGLFVCEIVLGAMSIEMLAPLLVSSCMSYLTINVLGDSKPLYEFPNAFLVSNVATAAGAVLLGFAASIFAKGWLLFLSKSRGLLNRNANMLPIRLAIAGVVVGCITIFYPEVAGNGAHIIRGIVSLRFSFEEVSLLLALKVVSVGLFFAMGAVGGVLTPSLTLGGISGFLFAHVLLACGVQLGQAEIVGYSLLGMAAFFTTAAAAPLTSLVLVVEFTSAGRMIFPLIIGVLVSHATSKIFSTKSMYDDETGARGIRTAFNKPLKDVRIRDIFRKSSDTVFATTLFSDIARIFIKNPEYAIHVVSRSNRYLGSILQEDVFKFIKSDYLSANVIADDIIRTEIPTLSPDMHLTDGVKLFAENGAYESLPIVDSNGKFYGVVNRGDIFMGFNEIVRREKIA